MTSHHSQRWRIVGSDKYVECVFVVLEDFIDSQLMDQGYSLSAPYRAAMAITVDTPRMVYGPSMSLASGKPVN